MQRSNYGCSQEKITPDWCFTCFVLAVSSFRFATL